jgi:methylglutaconyl-CoA hydratase
MSDLVITSIDARGVAILTLNRPEKHNAFDIATLKALKAAIEAADRNPAVRLLVITGAGKSFCSGADLAEMKALIGASEEDNLRDALHLTEVLGVLNNCPKPTVACVNGNAFGGAVGLIACCDIAVAQRDARLGLTEVRLGLAPAAISPYVVAAIGVRHARRYFQTAELIGMEEAHRIGLVHEIAAPDELDAAVEKIVGALLKGGPRAQQEAKALVGEVAGAMGLPDENLRRSTAQRLARLRVSQEGQEGMGAFLDKRPARWVP